MLVISRHIDIIGHIIGLLERVLTGSFETDYIVDHLSQSLGFLHVAEDLRVQDVSLMLQIFQFVALFNKVGVL